MPQPSIVRLGTRASKLAMIQADMVKVALLRQLPQSQVEICPMVAKGDQILDKPLRDIGGKGLFTKELDHALLQGKIDFAVHSLKDVETILPEPIELIATLPREDARDALIISPQLRQICPDLNRLQDLPKQTLIGTASVRRRALLASKMPHLQFSLIRGNVQTRLDKVKDNQYDATLLAMAGLKRLNIMDADIIPLTVEESLPAAAQGVIAMTCHKDAPPDLKSYLQSINHWPTQQAIIAERAVLEILDGSCHTPIAAHATLIKDRLSLNAWMANDQNRLLHASGEGLSHDAQALGKSVAQAILQQR